MDDRFLPARAGALGVAVALGLFLPLHLLLDADLVRGGVITAVGALIVSGLLWHIRREEVLRTTQAQGYFASVLIVVAIAVVMLPPGAIFPGAG